MSCNSCPPSPLPPWHRHYLTAATSVQTLTEDGEINLGLEVTELKQTEAPESGDAYEVTIPDVTEGCSLARKRIFIYGEYKDTTAPFRVTGTFINFTSLLFSNIGDNAVLEWNSGGWRLIGGNALPEP